ncbi:putative rRNA maturation factor [Orientia tsutsugamushi str. Gilliam]|uniref:Putative rRNA maturation factor n=1 Tax=Orientia tsutsugamushi str. Gilliam TaxID=1359184 RepID=A0A0F3MA96_ORITS|nr:putative rRNA maturation factor [Orientia tsutsugamushi str. Gilliam]
MKIKAALIRQHSIWRNHKEINLCYVKKIIKTTLYHNIFAKLQSVQQAEVVILLTNDHEMQNLNLLIEKLINQQMFYHFRIKFLIGKIYLL